MKFLFNRLFFLLLVLFLPLSAITAGDVVFFNNLGFSSDGKYFSFGLHGLDSESRLYRASIYVIDVAKNEYARRGILSGEYRTETTFGTESIGALFTLLQDSGSTLKSFNLDHLRMGRLLYLKSLEITSGDDSASNDEKRTESYPGEEPLPGEETITEDPYILINDNVLDFTYRIHLEETSNDVESSFGIALQVIDATGASTNFIVGHPQFRRKNIVTYELDRLYISPNNRVLVFVIKRQDKDFNIDYMIETQAFR